MITTAIFRRMAKDEVAGLQKDEDFFLEEAPLQHDGKPAKGVWLVTRGGDASTSVRKMNLKTTIDFYVAFENKIRIETTHQDILDWMIANRSICDLSGSVGGTTYAFSNVRLRPVTTPENAGITENGLLVKVASCLVIYDQDQ